MKAALAAVIFACSVGCVPAHAQVYQCTDANGNLGYQDHACPAGQKQKIIDVPSHAPPGHVPPPVATVAAPTTANNPLPAAVQAPVPTPLPVMYECVGAVNGKQYLTRSPPPPYLAPLGVMGYPLNRWRARMARAAVRVCRRRSCRSHASTVRESLPA